MKKRARPGEEMQVLHVRASAELLEKIDRIAVKIDRNRSDVVRMLLQSADETKVRPAAIGTAPVES